jgi:hypothetical protein
MRNISDIIVEKIKRRILYSIIVFRKSYRFLDNVEKYCGAGQAPDDKMACVRCMLDTEGYKHTQNM